MFEVAVAVLNPDGSPPEQAILVPWPEGCPVPMEGYHFSFMEEDYLVVDSNFIYCPHHDEPTVHIVLTLEAGEHSSESNSGADIRLPG